MKKYEKYNLGIARERTASVDLDYPQRWYIRVAYFLVGWVKIFIK